MIKHSILKQTIEGLVIDLYYSEVIITTITDLDRPYQEDEINGWLSHPDKTVKVDEGSKEKFMNHCFHNHYYPNRVNDAGFNDFLQQGIGRMMKK